MTGRQFRTLIEGHPNLTVNAFTEAVTADYLATHSRATEASVRRNVKRLFSDNQAARELSPRRLYRESISRVLGYDPFEVPTPHEMQRRLLVLEVHADAVRGTLIQVLAALEERGIRVPLDPATVEFLATPLLPALHP